MIRTIFTSGLQVLCFITCYLFFASSVFAGTNKYNAFTVKVTGKGQPILLTPAATCSGDEWNETVARYSQQYECHVFTLPGYAGVALLANGPYLETIKQQIEQYITDKQLNNVILTGVLVMAAYCKDDGYPGVTRDSVTRTLTEQYQACKTCTIHVAEGNTGHFIMYDNPDWHFKEIDNFVKN